MFSLPKQESKGSPFYDSFIYARDKYGPEKYFVWYNNWYSTEDIPGDDNIADNRDDTIIQENPIPLIVRKQKIEISGPPPPEPRKNNLETVDI